VIARIGDRVGDHGCRAESGGRRARDGIAAAKHQLMKMLQTIDLAQVTGGAAVTPDNFMPRAYALQTLNNKNTASPSPALKAQIHSEFCGNLLPYAKSGAPINSVIGGIARSKMIEAGGVCK
jgi:hypothetical protein